LRLVKIAKAEHNICAGLVVLQQDGGGTAMAATVQMAWSASDNSHAAEMDAVKKVLEPTIANRAERADKLRADLMKLGQAAESDLRPVIDTVLKRHNLSFDEFTKALGERKPGKGAASRLAENLTPAELAMREILGAASPEIARAQERVLDAFRKARPDISLTPLLFGGSQTSSS
jgi:hypothetical protein